MKIFLKILTIKIYFASCSSSKFDKHFNSLINKQKNKNMKKVISAFMVLLFFAISTQAQTTAVPTKQAPVKSTTNTTKSTTNSTQTSKSATTSTSTSATKVKADGTPDMRYKENKEAAKKTNTTTHKKADGTPDMRYKENKTK